MNRLLLNLLLTLSVELPAYLYFLRKQPPLATIFFILLINGLTLPLGTLAYHEYTWNYLLVEGLIFISEGLLVLFYLKKRDPSNLLLAFSAAFVANLLSMSLGWLLYGLQLL